MKNKVINKIFFTVLPLNIYFAHENIHRCKILLQKLLSSVSLHEYLHDEGKAIFSSLALFMFPASDLQSKNPSVRQYANIMNIYTFLKYFLLVTFSSPNTGADMQYFKVNVLHVSPLCVCVCTAKYIICQN